MTSRAFGICLAAVSGAPLLAAGLVTLCPSTTAAVIGCLCLAAGGVIGAVASWSLLAPGEQRGARREQATDIDRSLDAETRAALLRLGAKFPATPQSAVRTPQAR